MSSSFTPAERLLLLSARDDGGRLPDGYVAVGWFEPEVGRLQALGLFDGDVLTDAGAVVAAGLTWKDKT